jgi:hypothetical protein
MGARHLPGALALALACGGATAAQLDARGDRQLWDQHRATLFSERTLRFLRHFEGADQDQRRAAVEALLAARKGGAADWTPTLDVLRRVESLVADATGDAPQTASAAALDALAGALDLVAIPGAFACAAEGLGDPLTVRVRRVYGVTPPSDFVLELHWRSNDGVDVRARREPVASSALSDAGFEMYLRAPLSGPAPWHLYGMVGDAQSSAIVGGIAEVRVDAVERLAERAQAVLAREADAQPGRAYLAQCLRQLLTHGARPSAALGAGEMIGALEAWGDGGPPPGVPVPVEPTFVDRSGLRRWMWTYGPEAEPSAAVIVTASSFEAADHALAGVLGEHWTACAERAALQLFSLHVPSDPRALQRELERARAWVDGRPVYLVARGDALALVELALKSAPRALVDGLVLSGGFENFDPARVLPQFERLVMAPAAARHPSAVGYRGVEGRPLSFLNDLELPAHVERWIVSLRAASPGDKAK